MVDLEMVSQRDDPGPAGKVVPHVVKIAKTKISSNIYEEIIYMDEKSNVCLCVLTVPTVWFLVRAPRDICISVKSAT